jgi:hypothetical protein
MNSYKSLKKTRFYSRKSVEIWKWKGRKRCEGKFVAIVTKKYHDMLGSILGGIFGARSASKQRKMLENEKKKNEQWYNRRYNEVGTERADAQAALTAMRDAQKERSASARGAAAAMGGSAESVAAEKEAANKAMASTIATINGANESRKDSIENQYMNRDASLAEQQLAAEQRKANAIAQAGAGLDKTFNKGLDLFFSPLKGKGE